MLVNLKRILDDRHIAYRNFWALLGLSESAGQKKMYEENDLKLGEARKIMAIFPEYTMDHLFASDGNKRVSRKEQTA